MIAVENFKEGLQTGLPIDTIDSNHCLGTHTVDISNSACLDDKPLKSSKRIMSKGSQINNLGYKKPGRPRGSFSPGRSRRVPRGDNEHTTELEWSPDIQVDNSITPTLSVEVVDYLNTTPSKIEGVTLNLRCGSTLLGCSLRLSFNEEQIITQENYKSILESMTSKSLVSVSSKTFKGVVEWGDIIGLSFL